MNNIKRVLAAVLLAGAVLALSGTAHADDRLGGHEAPPGIITAFLGEHIGEALNDLE
uniref:Uncharacterized protein n=1 Tax=Streptomyces sp. NBC_00049 TaxID=2903617 RepID=A0AAU2K147_9ACTN